MPLGLAAGSSSIFFANGELGYTYVYGVPKIGGAPTHPYSNGAGENRFPSVSAEAHSLAFLSVISGGTRDILRGNEDGTSSFTVAQGQVGSTAVLLRAPYVYWTTPSGILRISGVAPQPPEVFATDAAGVTELVADDTTLYWCPTDGKLRALRFDQPATAPVILESGLKAPQGFAVDAANVYWASGVTGEVRAIPKAGGASTIVAGAQPDPWSVAVNDTAVFFTNRSAGSRPLDTPRIARTGDVHDFDFFAGAWVTRQHRLRARGVGSNDWEEFPATLCMALYLGGTANVDERYMPTKAWAGLTLRTFDLEKRQWSIYWVSSKTGTIGSPVVGGFDGNRGEFYGDDEDNGHAVKVRYAWTKLDQNHAHWEQAFSYDRREWETNWTADFARADPVTTCEAGRPKR
jgi:hypothetical protein